MLALKERKMTSEEIELVTKSLEEHWRQYEGKLMSHIPEEEKYLYMCVKSQFVLEKDIVIIGKNGHLIFEYDNNEDECSHCGYIFEGKVYYGLVPLNQQ